jgi:hypothetical protein
MLNKGQLEAIFNAHKSSNRVVKAFSTLEVILKVSKLIEIPPTPLFKGDLGGSTGVRSHRKKFSNNLLKIYCITNAQIDY